MSRNLAILGLFFLPTLMQAQPREKCADVTVVPKALYDSFQNLKASLNAAERLITKERSVLDDLMKRYLGCETQPDVATMLQQAEEALKTAEASRKKSGEDLNRVDGEVREIIRTARGKPVVYRYYDPYNGNFGTVVTMNFAIVDGKVTTTPSYYQLPDIATR